jgi:hypothetical protein
MRARNRNASLELDRTPFLSNPFESVAKRIENNLRRLIECEVRKYKSSERLRGRDLSWKRAWEEWKIAHQVSLDQFLIKSLFTNSE